MEAGKRAGTPQGKMCSNLTRNFQTEANKLRQREELARPGSDLQVDGCHIHGNCDALAEAIDLDEEKHLTKFICFLATLKFKLYHVYETPDLSPRHKQAQCNIFLNIMFLFLQYGSAQFYHYPLRALAEFFSN